MSDSENLEKKLKHYRLSRDEYERLTGLLGRAPQGVEWALFSALWSEHCSYKSSRIHLKSIFNRSERVLAAFGENAGVLDLGQGERIAFKIESHNHPSYIEPYEGAATGVGGILRDIFAMGARPIALANYLAFGEMSAPRMTALVDGVVRGVGGYGNCVGVPTITGQAEFHRSYNKNILVNALALGLFREGEPVLSARATGVGNLVVYVGAKTGKDGVHGASMASESFDSAGESKKPTIQKGDPFYEKLLIESCLEVMRERLVEAVQDMGAAGLTSSSFEMAARGGVGFKLELDRVPLRDRSMTAEEILLSESQERMLLIVRPENIEKVKSVFTHWSLDAEEIGTVTIGPDVELFWHGECICRIDPRLLTDEAPRYERPFDQWSPKHRVDSKSLVAMSASGMEQPAGQLLKILASPLGGSRAWIYRQYDQRVGAKTVFDCEENTGVVRLPDSGRQLALVLGGRPHVMRFDARVGGADSVAYPALELAAKGFLPLGVSDCLNFGNPENRDIMSEFVAALDGMNEVACELATPVISGNVSFYNETLGANITSTVATGLVGLGDPIDNTSIDACETLPPRSSFQNARDELFLLECDQITFTGMNAEFVGGATLGHGDINSRDTARFIQLVRHLALAGAVRSTRVVGKFGLPYALARMCTPSLGAKISWEPKIKGRWFDETLYQVIFAVEPDQAYEWRQLFEKIGANLPVKLVRLGEVTGDALVFEPRDRNQIWSVPTVKLRQAYETPWEI